MGRREPTPFTRPRRRRFWGILLTVVWSFAAVMGWTAYRHEYAGLPNGVGSGRHEIGMLGWLVILEDNVTPTGAPPPGGRVVRRWVWRPVPIVLTALVTGAAAVGCAAASRALVARGRLRGRCDECGYDLSGAVAPRCPECGAATPP